jgi:hypothetical protein
MLGGFYFIGLGYRVKKRVADVEPKQAEAV